MIERQWWGYLHINGHIQVKPLFDSDDLSEAHLSPMVERVFPVMKVRSREDAILACQKILEDEGNLTKDTKESK